MNLLQELDELRTQNLIYSVAEELVLMDDQYRDFGIRMVRSQARDQDQEVGEEQTLTFSQGWVAVFHAFMACQSHLKKWLELLRPEEKQALLHLNENHMVVFHLKNTSYVGESSVQLQDFVVGVLLNDTFHLASADSEDLEPHDFPVVSHWAYKHGWGGVIAWCARKRGYQPLKESLRSPGYREAVKALEDKKSGLPELK